MDNTNKTNATLKFDDFYINLLLAVEFLKDILSFSFSSFIILVDFMFTNIKHFSLLKYDIVKAVIIFLNYFVPKLHTFFQQESKIHLLEHFCVLITKILRSFRIPVSSSSRKL